MSEPSGGRAGNGRDADLDPSARRIRDWIVERLYADDRPELGAVEPVPLFDVRQVEDGREIDDD